MKYKVNDQVRVREDLKENNFYGGCRATAEMEKFAGKIVTISRVNEHSERYKVKEDEEIRNWSEEMFEGLATFTKSDLKEGDICTLRNGDKEAFMEGDFCGYDLDGYEEDLTSKDGDKNCDIVKVERPTKLETVFERKEEPKEMTLKEVCEKLGYEVKIIKEN